MLVILWWKRGVFFWKRDVLPLIPLLALSLLDGWVAMRVEGEALGPASVELQFTLIQRLVIAGHAFWFYLGKLFWPSRLCPIYPRWQIQQVGWTDYLYPLGLLALLIVLWAARKKSRAPLAATLFFLVSLLPLLGLVSFSYFRYSFVADHFQYLASLGIIALVAAGLVQIVKNFPRQVSISLSVALLTVLGGLTWRHSSVYANLGRFTRATLAQNPESWAGHDFLGLILTSQGKPAEAIEHFNRALSVNPGYALGHYNLGCALELEGKSTEAIHEYERAIQLQPTLVRAHYNLGCVLASQRNFKAAIEQYEEALRLKPDSIDAPEYHNNLGIALASFRKA